jgi:hypothetical protein
MAMRADAVDRIAENPVRSDSTSPQRRELFESRRL